MAPIEETFRFGEFTFDCRSHQLLRDHTAHHLSPKAQQLLQLLLQARPRAVSREELYDALWPSTFVCETNLARIVNELRRTLGDDVRAAQYIRTVHGFGYAFCGELTCSTLLEEPVAILLCEGRRHPLYEGENTIGRAIESHVVMSDPAVSRHHAVITIDEGEYSIHDVGSKNGTFVDGRRVGRSPVPLTADAQVQFGAAVASIQRRSFSSTATLRAGRARRL